MFKKLLAALHVQAQGTMLKVGDKAPAFTALDHRGRTVRSEELAGKRWVLWFYPKADTPG